MGQLFLRLRENMLSTHIKRAYMYFVRPEGMMLGIKNLMVLEPFGKKEDFIPTLSYYI